MKKKIYITGMHSGQNPSSGLGIARCLRRAFPDVTLVGVDHTHGSSGLHDSIINEELLLPQWSQIQDDEHAAFIRARLEEGHLWIAALDMEVYWLSKHFGTHPHLLAPNKEALEFTAKPAVKILENWPVSSSAAGEFAEFQVPDYISANLPDAEIHSFLRTHCWQCWLKSPYHDALRISSWSVFERARAYLKSNWKTSNLFLQRNVIGNEETISFAAHQGQLLGAVHLEKLQLTPEGKTWAGRVKPLDESMSQNLGQMVQQLGWTGGGELEFVRDPDGRKWIIECNPRFPAWIYGSALMGANLPGKLISHLWKLPLLEAIKPSATFTRVVYEIPTKDAVGLPRPKDPSTFTWATDGKHGKGGPSFSALLPNLEEQSTSEVVPLLPLPPANLAAEISSIALFFSEETPSRISLPLWTQQIFETLHQKVQTYCATGKPRIQIGYSVKTSPTDHHLQAAKNCGFYAECITQKEVQRALNFGFAPHQIILNGPGKFWPLTDNPITGVQLLFCDSLEEFSRVLKAKEQPKTLGLRIQLPQIHSRFGNTLSNYQDFEGLLSALQDLKRIKRQPGLAFHFHMPSWSIGLKRWIEALESFLYWCKGLEQLCDLPVHTIDLGGGYFPEDLEKLNLAALGERVHSQLPQVKTLYLEPGRSLTQESEILFTRILDIRKNKNTKANSSEARAESDTEVIKEIVVDACIAELPLAQAFPHRIFFQEAGRVPSEVARVPLGVAHVPQRKTFALAQPGKARILGRICMEDDILGQNISIPPDVQIGDLVIFGDAGGYERSMSYGFGRG